MMMSAHKHTITHTYTHTHLQIQAELHDACKARESAQLAAERQAAVCVELRREVEAAHVAGLSQERALAAAKDAAARSMAQVGAATPNSITIPSGNSVTRMGSLAQVNTANKVAREGTGGCKGCSSTQHGTGGCW